MNVRVGEKLDIYCPQSSNLEEPLFLKVKNYFRFQPEVAIRGLNEPGTLSEVEILRLNAEMVDSELILWEF